MEAATDDLAPEAQRYRDDVMRAIAVADPAGRLYALQDEAIRLSPLVNEDPSFRSVIGDALFEAAQNHSLITRKVGVDAIQHIISEGLSGRRALYQPAPPPTEKSETQISITEVDAEDPPFPTSPDDYNGASQSIEPALPAQPLALVTPPEWDGMPLEPVAWTARGRLPKGDVTVLSGDGGTGKTTIGLQLCCDVTRGAPDWLGAIIEDGPVLFYSAEETEREIRRRLACIASTRGFSLSDLTRLHLHFAEPDNCTLGIASPRGVIERTERFHSLKSTMDEIRPGLLVVDSVAAVYGGLQNDRGQARAFISLFRRLAIDARAAVLLLDHPSLSGMASGSGRAGSMDWSNAVRSRLYLRAVPGDDFSTRDLRELEVMKSNYGPAGEVVRLKWQDGTFVPEGNISSLDKLAAEAQVDALFLKLLDIFAAQGRSVSQHKSSAYAPSAFARHPDARGVTSQAFARAMERLFHVGKIKVEKFGPPSKQREKIVPVEICSRPMSEEQMKEAASVGGLPSKSGRRLRNATART